MFEVVRRFAVRVARSRMIERASSSAKLCATKLYCPPTPLTTWPFSSASEIAAMLAVADSRFQDELLRRARDAGKIEQSFELPAACRDNTPERIAGALAPAREAGLLPPFPFGSDFTAIEQRLIPALKLLRAASLLHLARLLARGFFASAPSGEPRDCLARMGLDHPSGATARVEAALLKAALEAPR